MCGRDSLFVTPDDLETRFDAENVADGGHTPRFNIAPGEGLDVVTDEATDEIDRYHWGLIPFWADGPAEGIVSARSEPADEKRVFERAWFRPFHPRPRSYRGGPVHPVVGGRDVPGAARYSSTSTS